MKIALIQGNYFPWIGYFSVMSNVDLFLVYEDVQYTKNDFRNRNWLHKSNKDGVKEKVWLTVPARHESARQMYRDIKIADSRWISKHEKTIAQLLNRNLNWRNVEPRVKDLFSQFYGVEYLFQINRICLDFIRGELNIKTPIKYIEKHESTEAPSKRVAEIVKNHGGTVYYSGPAAKNYIDRTDFEKLDIHIEWCNYLELITTLTNSMGHAVQSTNYPQSVLYDISISGKMSYGSQQNN